MKMRIIFPTLVALLLAATFATTQSSSAPAPDHGPSAFGQGGFSFLNPFRNPPRFEGWAFSFEATANKNDHARGRATFNIAETEVVVKINCMNVSSFLGSAEAAMLGTILHSDNPDYPKGAQVVFAAVDNSGSTIFHQDIMTPIFVVEGFEVDCHEIPQPLTMFQVGDAITIIP